MKKPPVDEADMCVWCPRTDGRAGGGTDTNHTRKQLNVTASKAVLMGGNFPADELG
jgi:hypothetical protein